MNNRKPFISGNWKMNKTIAEAVDLVKQLRNSLDGINYADVLVCPTFTALFNVADALSGSSIMLGAQNVHWENSGAFTGEISIPMLKEIGTKYVIIGHSERRTHFKETNEMLNKKLIAIIKAGINPIFCIGETLNEREKNETETVLEKQLREGLINIGVNEINKITIAYEPVWAIGTGKNATPAQANETHAFIRGLIGKLYNKDIAQNIRIQYGGSVTADNCKELINTGEIDGFLVGGASLKPDSFTKIVQSSQK